jgi:putative drug exporter of the RND superfamily
MSLGIMLAVIFVLAATLTLLPAVLCRLGRRVDKLALPWAHSGEHRSPRFQKWGERLWRQPLRHGAVALAILVGLALPITQLKTAMPSIKVVPSSDSSRVGYYQVQAAFGPGATGPLQIVTPAANATTVAQLARRDPGIAAVMPTRVPAVQRQGALGPHPRRARGDDRRRGPLRPGDLAAGASLNAAATAGLPAHHECRSPGT